MTRSRWRAVLFAALGALASAGALSAHESRPGYLQLSETVEGRYAVVWKRPVLGEMALPIEPVFPARCAVRSSEAGATVLDCPGGLAGATIAMAGLEGSTTDVLVEIRQRDGRNETHLLRPGSPSVALGGGASGLGRALSYLRIGVEHILLGVDHLLFVLGLLLIVADRWMLVKTITSFTVAHSITLAIATLGFASAPIAPLNAAIALSILFLGPEIVRVWRGQTSFTIRHPWVVAFAFGLLHGFGFASGLTAMGLPKAEIPLALLLFNVGVEVGQLAFVFLILGLERAFRVLEIRWPRVVEALPGYAVGSLGAYWTIQRTAMMLGGAR